MDLAEFRRILETMQPRQQAYEAVKKEMQKRGRWKIKPRGKPFAKE